MNSKYDHLKYPLILMEISLFLTICIFYLDEGNHSLQFLLNGKDIGPLLVYTFLISALPLFLYNYILETRIRKYSFVLALTGYMPLFLFRARLAS
jgi:hypothetical protein